MGNYLPVFRPGDTVTFDVTADVVGGQTVQVGGADRSVSPAEAGSTTLVGVAGHDAAVGDKVTVEIGKPIHELTASGAIALGDRVAAGAGGTVATAVEGQTAYGLAITAASDGGLAHIIQL
ncbi:capsid cement protein [Microbacterium halophytorum]|uniref:capsid cement protein n=1 Tax=Microbacterium halophytorum TaxID=2067568 RepID=UPI000CFAAA7E|nr:capsid cement protein [Microbacterium halophytorum]